jgi:hypothetical protein
MSAYATTPTPFRSLAAPAHVSHMLDEFIADLAERVAQRIADQAYSGRDGVDHRGGDKQRAQARGGHRVMEVRDREGVLTTTRRLTTRCVGGRRP